MPSRRDRPAPQRDDPALRERARETLHDALERGADLDEAARAALDVSDECAEAWLLLADAAKTPAEARSRIRRAVAVATAAIGRDALERDRGHLADTADGAAYLHALAALARCQVEEDRAAQAIQTLQHVIEADPRDPVTVRADLLLLLLATGRDDEAEDLVAGYADEAAADWTLARVLLRRRRATDEASLARATGSLDRAIERFPEAVRALVDAAATGPARRSPIDPLLRQAFEDTDTACAWVRARLRAADEIAAAPPAATSSPAPPRAPALASRDADRRFSALEHVEEAASVPRERREDLARRALELWPDCAPAWRLLAALADDPRERVARLVEAVAAGRRALGLDAGAAPVPVGEGDDARALLAARDDLARALRALGDEDGALAQERTLLVEDPDDPLGVGLRHVARLLALGRDADAAPVLDARAEDASPGWVWARVLAARRRGDRVGASFALSEATMVAPFVGPLLLAAGVRVPRPEGLSRDAFEAGRRAADLLRPGWIVTEGALAWLDGVLPRSNASSRGRPPRPPG